MAHPNTWLFPSKHTFLLVKTFNDYKKPLMTTIIQKQLHTFNNFSWSGSLKGLFGILRDIYGQW